MTGTTDVLWSGIFLGVYYRVQRLVGVNKTTLIVERKAADMWHIVTKWQRESVLEQALIDVANRKAAGQDTP